LSSPSETSIEGSLPVKRDPFLKRPLDITLASLGMLLSAPIWFVAAVAVKLGDRGPVLFTQARWGRGGRIFRVYKFRTMKVAPIDAPIEQAVVNDRRVTRVGKVLRGMGIDELPQFVNILKGDMSFVGPRALAVGESVVIDGSRVEYEEIPGFKERLAVRPGLTGLSTIYMPKDSPPQAKFETDLRYVEQQSFWLDLKLIVLSFWISIRGQWESREKKL
jgi:lipopolysaccharide/colanic/teichoic acid biosynthesis glycosyltransferase